MKNQSFFGNIINKFVMSKLHEIQTKITKLTTNIEVNYPELYVMLDEIPLTIPAMDHPKIDVKVMGDYLESLKQILKQYIATHKSK